jgi:glutaredoxin-like protein
VNSILDDNIKKQIAQIFSSLKEPVGIAFFGSEEQNCEYCGDTLQILEDLAGLSECIHLSSYDIERDTELARDYHVENAPAIVLGDWENGEMGYRGIHFYGVPAGHEFTSLIRDILMISARDSGLKPETRSFLADLEGPVHLQVFVTPSCPYCPQAVVLAHQMAYENDQVESEMIEAMEFPDLADQFGVSGVPHTLINDGAAEVIGAVPEAVLLDKIRQAIEDEI